VKKPAIPEVRITIPADIRRVLEPLKENVEQITAVRGDEIEELPSTATVVQIIAKINEILARLQ